MWLFWLMAAMFAVGLSAGLIVRRRRAVLFVGSLLILGGAVVFYAGLHGGWWGDGVGESWLSSAVLATVVSLVAYAGGEAVGYGLLRERGTESSPHRR